MSPSDEKFRQLAETFGYVFWIYSADLRQVCYISPRYELILGKTVDQARPEQWKESIIPEDRARVSAAFRKLAEGAPEVVVEFRILRPDGTMRWIEGRGLLVRDAEEKTFHLMGVAEDITQRKRIEEDLTDTSENARTALNARSQFLAAMTHEIRTPMSGVISLTGLLLETNLDREQRDMVETIHRSGGQILTIINDVLDFSKIDAGKMSLEMRDFDLQEVVEDALDLLATKAHAKGLEILGLVESNIVTRLRGDAGRLGQILINLLDNAVKFTERGGIFLRVSRQEKTAAGVTLRFEVKDTGVGIDFETRRHLFQPFRQAHPSTARQYGGTGLGLAIAKELVVMMNGEMGMESEPGQGSLFWFAVPFEEQITPASRKMDEVLIGLRVLLAVENPIGRHILQTKLRSLGMYPVSASGEEEAVAMLKKAVTEGVPFDLGILDLQLPKRDGLALARTIKADPAIAGTPLVGLNAKSGPFDAGEHALHGFEDVLSEPIRQSRLSSRLAAIVSHQEESTGAAEAPSAIPEAETTRRTPLILLAEDNPVNRKIALLQLKRLGYRADAVADGRDVIAALKNVSYDIVLMDCQMPELDGYETTKCIRRDYRRPIYIIALTAYALQADREKCLAVGMNDYLSKPVLLPDLKAAIERWGTGPLPA